MSASNSDGEAETLAITPWAPRRLLGQKLGKPAPKTEPTAAVATSKAVPTPALATPRAVPARVQPMPAVDDDDVGPSAVVAPPQRISRGDIALVAGGISLGLISAFFPWYVFFNQDQFGIRAIKFNDDPSTGAPPAGATPAGRIADPIASGQTAAPALDTMSTGTLQQEPDEEETPSPPGLAEQPFPEPTPEFHVVHIANGRAMLQDDSGLWLVQRGSELPDKTRVAAIEQRGDRWVLVTSADRVIGIGE